jgi:hypothetical protein
MRRYLWIIILALISILVTGYGCGRSVNKDAQLQANTLKLQQDIQWELDTMDSDLSSTAVELSQTGLSGSECRQILNEFCIDHPYVVDCCTVDNSGRIVTMAPANYSQYEGSDISGQDQVIKLQQTKQAVLSQVFEAVEGFDAVDLAWPILSENGDLLGSVSALFKPEVLFAAIIEQAVKDTAIEVWAMQLDGRIIYDFDSAEIGRNLFQDPLYQPYSELLSLGVRIAAEESGSGSYKFLNVEMERPVEKHAYWASVGLHGTAWRVVCVRDITE